MRNPAIASLLAVVCCFGAVQAEAADPRTKAARAKELRVLFIGNSYTKFNNLPGMLTRVAEGLPGHVEVRTAKNLRPGATLRHQWLRGDAVESIRRGGYTHVVLQAHSLDPFDRATELKKYARLFRHEIGRTGARPVLYETWARREQHFLYRKKPELGSPVHMTSRLSETYRDLGADLGADVAPVGRAFRRVTEQFPSIELYKRDGTHPSEAGTYLAACVFYGLLAGDSPEGTAWRPFGMDALVAHRLQRAAAEVLGFSPRGLDPAHDPLARGGHGSRGAARPFSFALAVMVPPSDGNEGPSSSGARRPLILRVSWSPAEWLWTLAGCQALLLGVDLLAYAVTESHEARWPIDMTLEANLPTAFASLQAGLVALAAHAVAGQHVGKATRWRRYGWLGIAALFFLMAIDDAGELHERFATAWTEALKASPDQGWLATTARSFQSYYWHFLILPFLAAAGVAMAAFLWRELGGLRGWLFYAGLGFFVNALVLDHFDPFFDVYRYAGLLWSMEPETVQHLYRATEEFLEMFGTTCILVSFLAHHGVLEAKREPSPAEP